MTINPRGIVATVVLGVAIAMVLAELVGPEHTSSAPVYMTANHQSCTQSQPVSKPFNSAFVLRLADTDGAIVKVSGLTFTHCLGASAPTTALADIGLFQDQLVEMVYRRQESSSPFKDLAEFRKFLGETIDVKVGTTPAWKGNVIIAWKIATQ